MWLRAGLWRQTSVAGILALLLTRCFFTTHGFPGGSDGEESACNAGDLGSIPGLGTYLGGGYGNPFQYSSLENPRQRILAGCSPWGRKESNMTEQLSTAQYWLLQPGIGINLGLTSKSIYVSINLSISVSMYLSSIYLIH